MVWWLINGIRDCAPACQGQRAYDYLQICGLVNIKLKWVKDAVLDETVSGQRDLKAACIIVSVISSAPEPSVPIYHLRRHRGQLGLPDDLKLSAFIRRYPSIFHETYFHDSAGTPVPSFSLTAEASRLRQEELNVLQKNQMDVVNRLRKLLMLTKGTILPLQTIDQLQWDLGLPYRYHESLIPKFPEFFSFVKLEDDRAGLKLLSWDKELAVSHLCKSNDLPRKCEELYDCLAFPVGFTRGYGLNRRCREWLEEWQKLPYTSPYADASHLDPRTDVSEKRIVGVFHELLHLSIQKQTEQRNMSNLRKPLGLPYKFTKVFERHPGIFYISKKNDLHTVVLREAYHGPELLERHPLTVIRQKYADMMKQGFMDRSRGLYERQDCRPAGFLKLRMYR